MRKFSAICFLVILLFNTAGYRWYFSLLEQRATARLENRIDAGDYQESQLVEIRIPLNMPYYSDREYESVYGETEWKGQHYRYVKRKVSNNILYLLCLPHDDKNKLVSARQDFAKQAHNIPAKQEKPSLVKLLLTEYLAESRYQPGFDACYRTQPYALFNTKNAVQFNPDAPYPPPRPGFEG